MSIVKTVSNLAEQVQMLVEENRTRIFVAGGQAKYEERSGAEAKAPAASHSHSYSEPWNSSITSPLTCSRSESVDLQGPPVSLIGLVTRPTPTKRGHHSLRGVG
ncbi:hypothetical protein Fot_42653 [Forsythia ovata]|uniref:Uncharacterized protein n=1 Tax=Forsythia ovata TaxID=205694 RepID=A0ABD1RMG5_9LAMI